MVNLITEHIDIWTAAQTQKANGGRGRGKNANGQRPYGIKKLREFIFEIAGKGLLVGKDPHTSEKVSTIEEIAKLVMGQAPPGKDCNKEGVGTIFVKTGEFGELYPEIREWTTKPLKFAKEGDVLICVVGATVGKLNLGINCSIGRSVAAIRPSKKIDTTYLYFSLMPYTLKLRSQSRGSAQGVIGKAELNSVKLRLPPIAEQRRIVAKVNELMALCDQLEQKQTHSNATHQTLVETLLATLTNTADQMEFAEAWQRVASHFDTLFTTEKSIDHLKQTILQLAVMGKLVPHEPMDLPAPVRASHADGPGSGKFFVYALECEDKSLYIGQTDDVLKRWKEHAAGKGSDWTKKHPPIRLVHWEEYNSREEAIKREKELKTDFGRKWLKRELAAGRTRQAGEPASVLLEKIAKEKTRLIKEGKIKKQKPLLEIREDEKPFELPMGWEWARPDDFSQKITDGEHFRPQTQDEGVYFLSAKDIRSDGISLEGPLYISQEMAEKALQRCNPEKGDILIVSRGATVGRMCTVDIDHVFCLLGSVILIKPLKPMLSDYLKVVMKTPQAFEQLVSASGSTAQPAIYLRDIKKIVFPIAPLAEQHRIVAKIDELIALCDTLKARLNDAQTTQIQLADAIVERAVAL